MKLKSEIDILVVDYIHDYPGFLKCKFIDAFGTERIIIEKVPVITTHFIHRETVLPIILKLSGTVQKEEYETNEIVKFTPNYNIGDLEGSTGFMMNKNDIKFKRH